MSKRHKNRGGKSFGSATALPGLAFLALLLAAAPLAIQAPAPLALFFEDNSGNQAVLDINAAPAIQCASNEDCAIGLLCCGGSCAAPACAQNSDCDDANALTTDSCTEPGGCAAKCANFPCLTACGSNAECDDGNSLTADACMEPASCAAHCANSPCTVACYSDSDCDDANALTGDVCGSPGGCGSYCGNTPCAAACGSDSDCDDQNSLTADSCVGAATCAAYCSNAPCAVACGSDSDCDDANESTADSCINSGNCNAGCLSQLVPGAVSDGNGFYNTVLRHLRASVKAADGSDIPFTASFFDAGGRLLGPAGKKQPVRQEALNAIVVGGAGERAGADMNRFSVELELESAFITKIRLEKVKADKNTQLLELELLQDSADETGREIKKPFLFKPGFEFENGTIELEPPQNTNTVLKCTDWNREAGKCNSEWVKIKSFAQGEKITIDIAPADPVFGFAEITIINVQSYPQVGGNWDVHFTTEGTADLLIEAIDGTDFESILSFNSLKCGEQEITPQLTASTLSVTNYDCNEEAVLSNKVLASGKHTLRFTFGTDTEYAYNQTGSPDVNVAKIDGWADNAALPVFRYAADGNLTIDFNVSDSDNNRLTVDINYSTANTQGSGTILVEDLNLVASVCPSQNWDNNVSQCHWDWNISGISDGNFYILVMVSDGLLTDFNASDNHFEVDNGVPDVNVSAIDGRDATLALPVFSYVVDGNLTIDFNVSDLTNFDTHLAGINYSSTNTQGSGTNIVQGLRVDGNNCITNFLGGFDQNHSITGLHSDVNLIAYYKFDGLDSNQSREIDSSGNGNHGQYIGGADNNANGKWDTNAGFFDGVNDYVAIANTASLQEDFNSGILTVIAWVYAKSIGNYDGIIDKSISGTGGNDHFSLNLKTSSPVNGYKLYIDSGVKTESVISANNVIRLNQWQQVAATLDGTNMKIYVDGQQSGSTGTMTVKPASNTQSVEIGRAYHSANYPFDGYIEEVKIYDRALTANEISLDYNYGATNLRKCSWDWNISGIADANYYATVLVADNNGRADFNASNNSFRVNPAPDVNVVKVDGWADNAALKVFGYANDGNLTIDFNVLHPANARLTADINYSAANTQGSGTIIVKDLNLVISVCPSQNWDNNVSQCHWDWNISGISDGNFYILVMVSDGSLTDFNASDNHFEVDNGVPDVNVSAVDGRDATLALPVFSYVVDGNLTFDFNVSDLTNFDSHLADVNYSPANTQGSGTVLVKGLRVDGNKCVTNFLGGFDQNHSITGLHSDVNLVGYYTFNGTDANQLREFDFSGNGNHGEYIGGADNNANGKWDTNAGFFDGVDDYVEVSAIVPTDNMTVTGWFKGNTFSPTYLTLVEFGDDSPFIGINGAAALSCYPVEGSTTLAPGTWYHFACVYEGPITHAYLNGSLEASDVGTAARAAGMGIGYHAGDGYFGGFIEEVKIYNMALSATEISQDYNYGKVNFRKCSWDWNISGIADANYYATVLVADNNGRTDFNASNNSFHIDASGPTTVDNDSNINWNNSDQNVQLKCADAGVGCKNLYYSVGDTNYQRSWGDGNIGIVLSTDANHRIFYWSGDVGDNNEAAHLIFAAVDKTAPSVSISSPTNGSSQTSTTVALQYTGSDATSDINKYFVRVDSGSWIDNGTNTSYSFSSQSVGSHTYDANAVDKAGNSTKASVTVTITTASSGDTGGTGSGGGGGGGGGYSGIPASPGQEENCVKEGFLCRSGRQCCPGTKCLFDHCVRTRCEKDSDCGTAEVCVNNACYKFFDIAILRADTPVKAGDTLDFTYLVKNPAGSSVDVNVSYWLDVNGGKVGFGSEVIFVEGGGEKDMDAQIGLPPDLNGSYLLVTELEYNGAKTRSTESIEIAKQPPLVVDISLSRLPAVLGAGNPAEVTVIVGTNSDERVKVTVKSVVLSGNKIVWKESKVVSVKAVGRVLQQFPQLPPGEYRWVITTTSGTATASIVRTITVEEQLQPAVEKEPTVEGIVYTNAVRYSIVGMMLILAVIISWHNLVIAKQLPKGHPVRKRIKFFYIAVFLICLLVLGAVAAQFVWEELQRLAANALAGLGQSGESAWLNGFFGVVSGKIGWQ